MKLLKALLLVTMAAWQATNAATLVVTSTADSDPGTLRAALASAADGDTIDASGVTGTILLTNGELLVTNSVTITGPGASRLAVDGNFATRVFHIASNTVVSISGLTITRGVTSYGRFPEGGGGGIWSDHATLELKNCVVSGSDALTHGAQGGGIHNDHGTLTVSGCVLNANRAGYGGGIFSASANVQIVNSTLSGNNSTVFGGGIYTTGSGGSASVEIVNSTLNGNSAGRYGGGAIYNSGYIGSATMKIANSTLSGNSASLAGGIYNNGFFGNASVEILNSTLSGNSGGGIYNFGYGGSAGVKIGSTILNAGALGENIFNDTGTVTSDGYNLSSDAGVNNQGGTGDLNATGDQINTDPMLGPLQDNGGPTLTHALLGCSPAIDQGKNFSASVTDQRGLPRPFDYPAVASATGGDGSDIGAFEAREVLFDTTPPTITCPDDQSVNATSPVGTVMAFAPGATDNCSLASVICTPPSGSTFAVGTTTVNCTATDGVGLMSSCAFSIYVKGAAEQISELTATVQSLPIDSGVKNGLLVKLQDALKGVNTGNKPKACSALQDFINQCNAQLAKRKLDAATANYLIGEATRIRAVIRC